MRLNLNLATQPYEDARRFLVQWGLLFLALVVISLGLLGTAVSSYMSSRGITRQTRELQAKIDELEKERATALAVLNQPPNRAITSRSQFLNTLIVRKAFSWTQVFADLEQIMPARVHVIGIRPEFSNDNKLELHLEAVGDSRDKAIELVRKLEQSSTFRDPQIRAEKDQPQGSNSGVVFEIVAQYLPKQEPGATEQAAKGGQ